MDLNCLAARYISVESMAEYSGGLRGIAVESPCAFQRALAQPQSPGPGQSRLGPDRTTSLIVSCCSPSTPLSSISETKGHTAHPVFLPSQMPFIVISIVSILATFAYVVVERRRCSYSSFATSQVNAFEAPFCGPAAKAHSVE